MKRILEFQMTEYFFIPTGQLIVIDKNECIIAKRVGPCCLNWLKVEIIMKIILNEFTETFI